MDLNAYRKWSRWAGRDTDLQSAWTGGQLSEKSSVSRSGSSCGTVRRRGTEPPPPSRPSENGSPDRKREGEAPAEPEQRKLGRSLALPIKALPANQWIGLS
jgi:hypothetical protein